ncbi:MAG TPA: hypothetical protein VNL91_10780, partial [Thermoanaerobaculia bacterium]|nr:hypothetical protein [Thermoanaerobaculia bacterium]
MKRQRILCSLICALGLFGTRLPADDGQRTAVSLGGVLLSDSGDKQKLHEDHGLDSGMAIEALRYDWVRDERTFRVDGFLTPAGEGWLRARYAAPAGWTMRFGLEQSRKWSDTSVGAPVTSYGTPLSSFFPGDNTARPAFGKDEILLERQSAWFDVMVPVATHG